MTKVEAIAAQLKERITAREWPVDAGLPSRGELALEYHVSAATITGAIRQLQKEGLVRVMQGKGAFVAEPQEGGRLPQSLIGLTGSYLPTVQDGAWFSRAIFDGIWEEANRCHQPVVLLPQLAMSPELTRDYCRQLGVEGLIFLGGEGYANARQLKSEGFPVILSNKPAEPTTLNYIDYDNGFVIREVVRRFVEAGHQRIGVLYAEGSVAHYYQEMKLQFLDELMQHGLIYDLSAYWRGMTRQPEKGAAFPDVWQAVNEMLDLPEPPTALFCWEPGMIPTSTDLLQQRKCRIPEDLSIIASSYGSNAGMEYSGFVVPHHELGVALVQELCKTVENPHHSAQRLLRPRFEDHGTVVSPPARQQRPQDDF